ncbi:MAG: thioesterase [Flavobacteriaceae bacterium]|nr:thioesterase [Flavobacteriaceae bacterium]
MKVLAFPFAGGNKYSFNFLKSYLNPKIRLEVFEYAGRGNRVSEKPIDSLDSIVNDLWPNTLNFIKEEPYIIFGHSMGGLVAFLMCHKIQKNGLKKPSKLIISGRKAPQTKREEKIWNYPSEQFWKELINLGGIPKEIQNEATLRDFFEPIIRADFKAVEEFFFQRKDLLDIPIEVLYGDKECKNKKDFLDWSQETTNEVNFYIFKGNHFFIHDYAQDIANHFI